MFGWVDFREDEKKKKNIFCEGLVEGRGGKKKLMGPACFFPGSIKMFSLQIEKKTRENINGL